MIDHEISRAIYDLERATAIIIPVYLGRAIAPDHARAILGSTVHMFARETHHPEHICLCVDGPDAGAEIAQEIATHFGTRVVVGDRNRGKFGALLYGMQTMMADERLKWFATVDQDGDHFGNDLLNFVRAAQHVVETSGIAMADAPLLVLGNRATRHRPLGFLRAEQEVLSNLMLMDALTYAATLSGKPLHLEYLTTTDPLPDFHSGYKLISRASAHAIFSQEPPLMGLGEHAAFRHACEAVMVVEAHLNGATLAAINRRTFDEQPISNFANYHRASLAADMILWPCKRLGVPANFVAQWLANHLPTLLLGTLAPQGQEELLAIRQLVLEGYNLDSTAKTPAPFTRPRFV
jgi:hypothetical protein